MASPHRSILRRSAGAAGIRPREKRDPIICTDLPGIDLGLADRRAWSSVIPKSAAGAGAHIADEPTCPGL